MESEPANIPAHSGRTPPQEEVGDPEHAEADNEPAENPPSKVERQQSGNREEHEIHGSRHGQETVVDGKQAEDPGQENRDCQRGQQPVQPLRPMQRQKGDGEGKDQGKSQDQPGWQNETPFETLEGRPKPMVSIGQTLLASRKLFPSLRRTLDYPAHEIVHRSRCCVNENDNDKGKRHEIRDAPCNRDRFAVFNAQERTPSRAKRSSCQQWTGAPRKLSLLQTQQE